jgi:SAM-dependent methyltransferase
VTETANLAQHERWNGDGGRRWVATADRRDEVLGPVADALLAAARPAEGERVLDVGCGCGVTTLLAGRAVGATGAVTGIDLSEPMLDVARARADHAPNVRFLQADAQTHRLDVATFDLVISRFGSMFFDDPVHAFANLADAMKPGSRMCMATWRPLDANEWLVVPGAALLRHAEPPASATATGPGMFGQSDPSGVTATLSAAGLSSIELNPVDVTFRLGATVDDAVDYLAEGGPGREILETIPAGTAREAAIADVREALSDHADDAGVQLGGGIWIISARR